MRFLIAAFCLCVAVVSASAQNRGDAPRPQKMFINLWFAPGGPQESGDSPSTTPQAPSSVNARKLFINLWPDPEQPDTGRLGPEAPRHQPPDALIVDASGDGDYSAISAAVEAAAPDAIIWVRPGVYRESLVISKPVAIVGAGARDEIIIESDAASAVIWRAPAGRLAGLTVRATETDAAYGAIWVMRGAPVLADLDLSSAGGAAVYVTGIEAAPILRRNRIHNSKQNGVFVYDGGAGRIENNEIFGNGYSGVAVYDGAAPTVLRNRIRGNAQSGVFLHAAATGWVEGNEISGNAYNGVAISAAATPMVVGNRIHGNAQSGVFVYDDGGGRIENNDIFDNGLNGVAASQGGDPQVAGNRIIGNGARAAHQANRSGVRIYGGGRGRVTDNIIVANLGDSIHRGDDAASVALRDNIAD